MFGQDISFHMQIRTVFIHAAERKYVVIYCSTVCIEKRVTAIERPEKNPLSSFMTGHGLHSRLARADKNCNSKL